MILHLDSVFYGDKQLISDYLNNRLSDYSAGPVYGILVTERHRNNEFEIFIDQVNDIINEAGLIDKFYLIANEINNKLSYSSLFNQPLFIDYFALKTMVMTSHYGQKINTIWNSSADKALFLTGKANKKHRVGLLSKFYDRDMMSKLEWSFFLNTGIIDDIIEKKFVSHYSQEELNKFFNFCLRNPDSIHVRMNARNSHYSGFPYDVNLYSATSISCVSETDFGINPGTNPSWITEKTWKAIVNKHPFIIAGESRTLETLDSQGFKTFKNYIKFPNYLSEASADEKISMIAENVKYFLERAPHCAHDIEADIEFNFKKFQEYSIVQWNKLSRYLVESDNIIYSEYDIIKTHNW